MLNCTELHVYLQPALLWQRSKGKHASIDLMGRSQGDTIFITHWSQSNSSLKRVLPSER
jgi:hypothetical protein